MRAVSRSMLLRAASRSRFFKIQAIKSGHISIIYQQTGDSLSVSSKWTADAKWRTKFQDNFANTAVLTPKFHSNSVSALCEGWLQWIASVTQGHLTLQNHRCKTLSLHFCEIKIGPILPNTNKTALINVFVLNYPSRRSKPQYPVLLPAVQWKDSNRFQVWSTTSVQKVINFTLRLL